MLVPVCFFHTSGSARADADHRTAAVPAESCWQQSGVDLPSLWSPWSQLPVVQRQRRGPKQHKYNSYGALNVNAME